MKSTTADQPAVDSTRPLRLREILPGIVAIIAVGHTAVDTVASQMHPLWPELGRYFSLDGSGIYWMIILWTSSATFAQVVFGYLSDRIRLDCLIWLAPGMAAICVGMMGLTDSVLVACLLMAVGGVAIASFHPEAATLCGAAMPGHRSRGISIFIAGGFLGQTCGPLYGGLVVRQFGIAGLSCGILWGLVAMFGLMAVLRTRREIQHQPLPSATVQRRGDPLPWKMLSLILAIQTLRVIGATGVPLALAFILDARGVDPFRIGVQHSVFLGGIGMGGLICAMVFQQRQERRLLIGLPVVGTLPFLLLTVTRGWPMTICIAMAAITIGMAMPVLISYGQQLVPAAQRLASSMAMGVSWGIGGCLATIMVSQVNQWPHPEFIFIPFAVTSLGAGLVSLGLPRIPAAAT